MASEAENDVNSAFDDIFLTEDRLSAVSFEDGYESGLKKGAEEGFHLGYHRGAELGAELGFYSGVVEAWLSLDSHIISERALQSLHKLQLLIKEFPRTNLDSVDIIASFDKIRVAYKKVDTVREKLNEVCSFLEPFKILANAHMTSFITDNCWQMLPEDIINEASSLATLDMYEIFWSWGSNPENFQHPGAIGKFLNTCWHFSLASKNFRELMLSYESYQAPSKKAAKCMSLKKTHEVSTLKEIVAYLCDDSQSNCVVDVGGGKGYLGASLVLEKRIKVLSIDSKPLNTEGAIHIFGKIEKHERVQGDPSVLYKQVTAFVTPETDLISIAKNNFGLSEHRICLTGLHVCGNLAATCIKHFCKNQDIVSVCSIGCCYNLLTERFETDSSTIIDNENCGFPLSNFLNNKRYCLGRNARMIACQPIDRICLEKREMKLSIFWRAAIQIHFQQLFGPQCDITVGRRCSKATSFSDYCVKVEKSLNRDLELSEDKVNNLVIKTEKFYDDMIKFYCFRLALAPVVETLLILDRLLHIHEQGLETSYICKVFDGVTSPRCHAVIAMKHNHRSSEIK